MMLICFRGLGFHRYISVWCPTERRVRIQCAFCQRERKEPWS